MKRVVVTGLGVVTPIGCCVFDFWKNLKFGNTGIELMDFLKNSPIPSKVGGVVSDFELSSEINHIERRLSRPVSFAIEAAHQCMKDSGLLSLTEEEKYQFVRDVVYGVCTHIDIIFKGVCVGTGLGSPSDICDAWDLIREDKYKKVPPFFITKMLHNMVSSYISIDHQCKGPVISLNTACATGQHAIGEGYRKIQHGECSRMLVGATESAMDEVTFSGFCRIQALSSSFDDHPELSSRPFDSGRDGFVVGEGSGILLLEELETALERDAKIYAEIGGYGCTGDAFHLTQSSPDGEGQVRAMEAALREAGIQDFLKEVDYVNAHATSTPLGDEIEYNALVELAKRSSGSSNKEDCVQISSIKGSIGHLMGASGAVEAVASVMSISDNIIQKTVNYGGSDFDAVDGLNILDETIETDVNCVLSNSFGFGGTNSCIIFKHLEE